jgi:hypothetical protein
MTREAWDPTAITAIGDTLISVSLPWSLRYVLAFGGALYPKEI